MSSIQIPNLPAVIGLDGSELFEGVQAGTSVKISLAQMIAATRAGLPTTLPIPVSVGGTGLDTFTIGDIMYASATQTFSKLADVALGNAIISGGVGAAPSYGKIGLTTHVSGVLPVANGGTNQSAVLTQYGMIYGDTTTSMASTAAGTSTTLLHGNAAGAPTWSAVSLTADVSGILPVANGGTNITSYTIGDLIYASTAGVLSKLADVATGNALISGGVGVAPSYGKIILSTAGSHVTGTLPVGNGGTGQASNLTQYGVVYGGTTTEMATSAAGTATQVLHGNAAGAPTFSAVSLTADVSGILPVANGGTGVTTSTGTVSVVLSDSPALTGNVTVTTNSASAAVTINQTGAGNAFVVEDSASPDASPFVIDASGNVGIGMTSPGQLLNLYSATSAILQINGDATTNVALDRASTDTTGPVLGWRKRRGTTASPLAVVSGDATGTINYAAYDGSTLQVTSQIINSVETFTGLNDVSGFMTFFTRPTGAAAASTERMRITAAGNVGIGTSGPVTPLHVTGASITTGVVYKAQPAQTSKAAAATLTIAELLTGIVQYTGAVATLTLPTGTSIEGGLPATFPTDMSFDVSFINTGAALLTIGANGNTTVGTMTVATGTSDILRFRKTAANTYTVYRIS